MHQVKTAKRATNYSLLFLFLLATLLSRGSMAQQSDPTEATPSHPVQASGAKNKPAECGIARLDKCALDVAKDQLGIWTSPLRLHSVDALWLLPFAGATGASIYYDNEAMQRMGTSHQDFGRQVSKYSAPYVSFGAGAGLYLLGAATHREHLRETGLLGAEAVVDASILTEGLKFATNRDRPFQGNGQGDFWPHGIHAINTDASMPSGHAAAAWALARVVSMQYPDRPLFKMLAYGAALTVSAARVTSRDHFPSDVLVGSTFGFLTGGYVVRHRSTEYKDTFSYSLQPLVDHRNATYGVRLSITPGSDFDECRLLPGKLKWLTAKMDRHCAASAPREMFSPDFIAR
jgi:membrane-associated phospholipid phosphatase